MATTIRITLLRGFYGTTIAPPSPADEAPLQLDYPPAPWTLLQTLLQGMPDLEPVVQKLAGHPPVYHLPYGQLQSRNQPPRSSTAAPGQLWLGQGAALHVRWPVDLSAEEERLLTARLGELSWIGRPEDSALWQVVASMPEPNCRPAPDGTLLLLCWPEATADDAPWPGIDARNRRLRYAFQPGSDRQPKQETPTTAANRAVYAVDASAALPTTAGIAWTDRLHRALLQRAPCSPLFAGLAAGRPLPEDQRAWYRWYGDDHCITQLEVISPQPFDEAELDALLGLRQLFGPRGLRIPLRLLQLDAMPPRSARHVRTTTPMLLYTTPRPGKLQRTPAAQAIQTLLWGLGEEGKLDPQALTADGPDDAVCLSHASLGRIRAQAWPANEANLVTSRSDRRAASTHGFHAVLSADAPLPLLAVGWGRHFGAGRLVACDQHQADSTPEARASLPGDLSGSGACR